MEETEQIEFKKSVSEVKEGIRSIVAILNKHKRGTLYFGLDSEGKPTKETITEKTLRDISQAIANHVEPKVYPKIKREKGCIKISFKGNDTPYFAYGKAYIRTADEDRQLSIKELEKMILYKNKDKIAWDKEICEEAKLQDVSAKKVKSFLKDSGKNMIH